VIAFFLVSLAATSAASPTMPTFFARRDYTGLTPQFIQVADTNGDGIPDLIAAGPSLQVLFGNGDGTFRSGPSSTCASDAVSFVATSQLGDGHLDVVFPLAGCGKRVFGSQDRPKKAHART
jgi:hypothetical protein